MIWIEGIVKIEIEEERKNLIEEKVEDIRNERIESVVEEKDWLIEIGKEWKVVRIEGKNLMKSVGRKIWLKRKEINLEEEMEEEMGIEEKRMMSEERVR